MVRQLRTREPATPHDREPSSRGIIAFSVPLFLLAPVAAVDYSFSSLEYVFSFVFSLFLLPLLFYRLWFFELAFHLVLSLVRATIRVVELVFCSNVPAISLACLVLVHRLQTCRASVSSASLVLRRVGIVATLGREIVVFRLLPSSGRTYPVSITGRNTVVTQFPSPFFWHYVAPGRTHWKFVCVFCYYFSCSS